MKSYLRYVQDSVFGVISSAQNVIYDASGKYAISPALEHVLIWDIKRGSLIAQWHDASCKSQVTFITKNNSGNLFAVGYHDGSIRLWDFASNTCSVTFNGHKAAISTLKFNQDDSLLVSGSKDTDIVIWDVVGESGLMRFSGHKDQITGCAFIKNSHLVSVSKDTLLKVWDLDTKHCVETIIAHRSEVWSLAYFPQDSRLMTVASDQEIRVWDIHHDTLQSKLETRHTVNEEEQQAIQLFGHFQRISKERALSIQIHPLGLIFGVAAADKTIELYRIRSSEELEKILNRRKKRQREKGKSEDDVQLKMSDYFPQIAILRTNAKVSSFDFSPVDKSEMFHVLVGVSNNSIALYSVDTASSDQPYHLISELDIAGHRNDVRTLCLSSDDELLMSGSNTQIKIWNLQSKQCIKTMASGYALCGIFVPGNKHVIIGTKTGEIEIYDLSSGSLLETIKAHTGPVWSIDVRPDKTGFASGSADKDIKFWDFHLILDPEYSKIAKRLTIVHARTLRMSDDVLVVKHSPDGKKIAASLLDATIKVFFYDTLKFSLSLYGHKLPVLSMDISSDSNLLVTGSADKSMKIWGLDFGDCHKSILAHKDSITSVKFVWGTHYVFTTSRDGSLIYWDADKFEKILRLDGHHGEIWALAVGKFGNFVVTGSHDRSIRVWKKTDEQVYLDEEREKEMEDMLDKATLRDNQGLNLPIGALAEPEGHLNHEKLSSQGDLKSGEKIVEALEIWLEDKDMMSDGQRHAVIAALGDPKLPGEYYVLKVIEKIRLSDLHDALLVLPYNHVLDLLNCISFWLEKKELNVHLCGRILNSIFSTHFSQLTLGSTTLLDKLSQLSGDRLNNLQDIIGFNLAGLKHLQREYEAEHGIHFPSEKEESVLDIVSLTSQKEADLKRKRMVLH